ncbi:MAG: phage regulatory CII family protein [Geobacteraceae bacterium]
MKSYEAMERCIGRNTVAVAKAIQKSVSLVGKWKEPALDFTDSGTLNPLDRLESVIRTAIIEGQSKDDAMAPILYLAQRFNFMVIALPDTNNHANDIVRQSHKCIKEFGDYISTFSDALLDGRITPSERKSIEKEGFQAIQQIMTVLQMIEVEC